MKTSKDLVLKETMTSLEIAECSGKRHDNVVRDIREIEIGRVERGRLKFEESYYTNSQNKKQPMYVLTKKETLLVVSKYNDELREKIIDRWEELEIENARLKEETESRNLCKLLYRKMTDALKEHREELGKETNHFHYSNEADMINRLVFGMDSKKWRTINPESAKTGNQRDFATIEEKNLISKLEELNKAYLDTGFEFEVRKGMLKQYIAKKRKLI